MCIYYVYRVVAGCAPQLVSIHETQAQAEEAAGRALCHTPTGVRVRIDSLEADAPFALHTLPNTTLV